MKQVSVLQEAGPAKQNSQLSLQDTEDITPIIEQEKVPRKRRTRKARSVETLTNASDEAHQPLIGMQGKAK